MAPLRTPARTRPPALLDGRAAHVPATRAARPRKGPDLHLQPDDEWQERGACREESPSLFFAPDHESPHQRRVRESAAKAVCSRCPVRSDCRAYAVQTGELYGIWGGTTERERARTHPQAIRAGSTVATL